MSAPALERPAELLHQGDPHLLHVTLVDRQGEPVAGVDLTQREAISLGAALTGEEEALMQRYNKPDHPQIVERAYREVTGVVNAAVVAGYVKSAVIAKTADEHQVEAAAWRYITNIRGTTTVPHAESADDTADGDEGTVKVSAEDLFDDTEEDDEAEAARAVADDFARVQRDVRFHAKMSKEYQDALIAEDEKRQDPKLSVEAAAVALRGLALQAGHVDNPALAMEITEVEAKLQAAVVEAARHGAVPSASHERVATMIEHMPKSVRRMVGVLMVAPAVIVVAAMRR